LVEREREKKEEMGARKEVRELIGRYGVREVYEEIRREMYEMYEM
jgi:hypothetical protein